VNTAGRTTYLVQPGDNLFRISLRFNRSMAAIASANGITNYSLIYAGQVLVIP
jgi:LysM repeat protein